MLPDSRVHLLRLLFRADTNKMISLRCCYKLFCLSNICQEMKILYVFLTLEFSLGLLDE